MRFCGQDSVLQNTTTQRRRAKFYKIATKLVNQQRAWLATKPTQHQAHPVVVALHGMAMLGLVTQADLYAALLHCSHPDVVSGLHKDMLEPLAHVMTLLQDPLLVAPEASPDLVTWPGGPLLIDFPEQQNHARPPGNPHWAPWLVNGMSAWSEHAWKKLEARHSKEEQTRVQRLRVLCANAWTRRPPLPVHDPHAPQYEDIVAALTKLGCSVTGNVELGGGWVASLGMVADKMRQPQWLHHRPRVVVELVTAGDMTVGVVKSACLLVCVHANPRSATSRTCRWGRRGYGWSVCGFRASWSSRWIQRWLRGGVARTRQRTAPPASRWQWATTSSWRSRMPRGGGTRC